MEFFHRGEPLKSPDANRAIPACGNNSSIIRAEGCTQESICMPAQHSHSLPSLHIPDQRGMVGTHGNDEITVMAEKSCRYAFCIFL